MTETVVVALVTLASGVIGSMIGGFTAYKVAKFSAEKNIKQTLHIEKQQAYTELVESYDRSTGAITASMIDRAWLTSSEERTLYTRFQSAYAKAILVCSAETGLQLTLLLECANRFAADRRKPKELPDLFSRAVASMRRELREDAK